MMERLTLGFQGGWSWVLNYRQLSGVSGLAPKLESCVPGKRDQLRGSLAAAFNALPVPLLGDAFYDASCFHGAFHS